MLEAGPRDYQVEAGRGKPWYSAASHVSLEPWLLVFGITGLFLRYLDRPSPSVRYLVDASY